jgi:hypothetical protein
VNNKAKTLLAAVPVALALTACGSHSSHSFQSPVSHASSLAAVPGFTNGTADGEKALVKAGVPVHGSSMQQLTWLQSMKTKANREALAKSLEIPPQNRKAFEAKVLDAVKQDGFTTHADRVKLITDIENLVVQYQ